MSSDGQHFYPLKESGSLQVEEISKIRAADEKLNLLVKQIQKLEAEKEKNDTQRINWIESNPNVLKSVLYKGTRVWFVDNIEDFKTARQAIDYALKKAENVDSV